MKVAAQMYSIRQFTEKNSYTASLKALAKIGFQSVEHACGFAEFTDKPAELKKVLDDLGMNMMGTHLGADQLFDAEKRQKTAELYSILGAKYLICPGNGNFYDYLGQPGFIEKMNEAVEFFKAFNLKCGYHNHMNEFLINPTSGKTFWETFADATSKDVVLEQDCGWSTMASRNAAELIRKYPGRNGTLHFKPAVKASQPEKLSIIGSDSVNWAEIIAAAREDGNVEYLTIEQEWYLPGKSDMESIEQSFIGLSKLL